MPYRSGSIDCNADTCPTAGQESVLMELAKEAAHNGQHDRAEDLYTQVLLRLLHCGDFTRRTGEGFIELAKTLAAQGKDGSDAWALGERILKSLTSTQLLQP